MVNPTAPGGWNLTMRCDCGSSIIIEASDGPTALVTLPAILHLTCDACGRSATYSRDYVRHSRFVDHSYE
jgi:hypothetical protein